MGRLSSRFSQLAMPLLLTVTLPAAAVELTPGNWEVTMESAHPMMQAPRRTVQNECMTEPEVDWPAKMTAEMDADSGCEMVEASNSAREATWKIRCQGGGGPPMTGEGYMRSRGKSAEGKMTMRMSFQGQEMVMTNTWTGRHTGPCN